MERHLDGRNLASLSLWRRLWSGGLLGRRSGRRGRHGTRRGCWCAATRDGFPMPLVDAHGARHRYRHHVADLSHASAGLLLGHHHRALPSHRPHLRSANGVGHGARLLLRYHHRALLLDLFHHGHRAVAGDRLLPRFRLADGVSNGARLLLRHHHRALLLHLFHDRHRAIARVGHLLGFGPAARDLDRARFGFPRRHHDGALNRLTTRLWWTTRTASSLRAGLKRQDARQQHPVSSNDSKHFFHQRHDLPNKVRTSIPQTAAPSSAWLLAGSPPKRNLMPCAALGGRVIFFCSSARLNWQKKSCIP